MEQQQFLDEIIKNPVIAAVRDPSQLGQALESPVDTIFLLSGSINSLEDSCQALFRANRHFFLHVDLFEGLRPDQQGIRYIAEHFHPTGILTTKPACVKWAQSFGLLAVQRVFLLDSTALLDGSRHVAACQPDLVEVMPGVSPKAIRLAVQAFQRPLIAGGLISSREEVYAALSAGALAVSTGKAKLWKL